MQLQYIKIDDLKTATINVRKKGGMDVADLVPSIRSLGLLQPLLVRPNSKDGANGGYEIVAGQRRYYALRQIVDEHTRQVEQGIGPKNTAFDVVTCIVMDDGDDAKAIEASLAENIARLPMDEIDQHKVFAALLKKGQSVENIAAQFGITARLVKQRLAIPSAAGLPL